jgi:hypothetical protein
VKTVVVAAVKKNKEEKSINVAIVVKIVAIQYYIMEIL